MSENSDRKHIRVKSRMLSHDERKLVRELWQDHLSVRAQITALDREICDMMDRRDDLVQCAARTGHAVIAEKFDVSPTHITYLCKPRT